MKKKSTAWALSWNTDDARQPQRCRLDESQLFKPHVISFGGEVDHPQEILTGLSSRHYPPRRHLEATQDLITQAFLAEEAGRALARARADSNRRQRQGQRVSTRFDDQLREIEYHFVVIGSRPAQRCVQDLIASDAHVGHPAVAHLIDVLVHVTGRESVPTLRVALAAHARVHPTTTEHAGIQLRHAARPTSVDRQTLYQAYLSLRDYDSASAVRFLPTLLLAMPVSDGCDFVVRQLLGRTEESEIGHAIVEWLGRQHGAGGEALSNLFDVSASVIEERRGEIAGLIWSLGYSTPKSRIERAVDLCVEQFVEGHPTRAAASARALHRLTVRFGNLVWEPLLTSSTSMGVAARLIAEVVRC